MYCLRFNTIVWNYLLQVIKDQLEDLDDQVRSAITYSIKYDIDNIVL